MANNVKDLEQLIKRGRSEGWAVEKTNGGHVKWTHTDGEFMFSAQTPSDWRAIRNIAAILDRKHAQHHPELAKSSAPKPKGKRKPVAKFHYLNRSPVLD